EEFTDELALITYPPDYDDNLKCDIESDLREREFLLYQGKDSDLKDSIDQTDLANLDAYFVDPTPEMFTDEHAPDYSFPSRFDVYDDDFLEIESDADNFYDDPFDSKGGNQRDFSRDDDFPSPDNEDKVFNSGILIHEKSVTIITRVAKEKKLAISYASLVFKDFDPLFYEPIVFKDVPNSMRLLSFSSKNEEKVFKPGIYTSEKVKENQEKDKIESKPDKNEKRGEARQSKEDDVSRISTSIYVSNFPESFSAKDLFHSCKQYGHVVDNFIPFKRSKDGKRFGFVCFINVFNVERLVSNLCTIWVDRSKFHANIARFHRAPLNNNKVTTEQKFGYNRNINNVRAKEGVTTGSSKSYVHAVKVKNMFGALECDFMPSIVLDDECLISKYLSKALLGRVKEFASLPNLKIVLKNEGFAEIKIQEIVSVEIEGVPFKLWSTKTFKRIAAKWGELLDIDGQEEEGFHSKRLCIYSKSGTNIYKSFKVIFRGKVLFILAKEVPGWVPEFVDDSDDDDESDNGFKDGDAKVQDGGSCEDDSDENKDKSENMKPSDHSLKYPPCFTPNGDNNEFCMHEENVRSVNEANSLNCNMEENQNGQERNSTNKGSKEEILGSVCSGNFKKSEVPHTGGSILCVLEELVKVGQAMGYNMDGCVNNMTAIIESQGANKIEEYGSLVCEACWGNYVFDFVHSDSVGNSGGILCIWDPNSFRKNNVTVSDYFCMVRGVWLKTGVDILMVVVYAPQELRDKRILWDYLEHVVNQWDGEVVIMGDFNEVRFKSERFGSVFNVQGANVFNTFIANAGLEGVPLGGISFTWCHKSATKMSKLDRLEVLNPIQHLDKIKAMDVAQKAKIKWAIEGDENT
nr:nucleotide-binding alpha-beta plait domain-containing protein [Tanacetum cinerariifolium]